MNVQPWQFVVVESDEAKAKIGGVVYAASNVESSAFAVAIATQGGGYPVAAGRAMPSMCLVARNEGVVSSPDGMADQAAAARAVGLDEGWLPVNIPSFG